MTRDRQVVELSTVVGPPRVQERSDAARNRRRVLDAAERLFADRGVTGVTMDDIAAEAGVGKGTLYRRFSDKGGLAGAVLDERGTELQQEILAGDPPLGPGAPPAERLVAFTRAYLSFQTRHLDLVLLSETSTPGGRLRKAAYVFWRQHLRMLLNQAGAPDPLTRAEVLLAGLSAEQVEYWLRDQERPAEQLATSLAALAAALARPQR
jgi:AcrR family transcriptional regulator